MLCKKKFFGSQHLGHFHALVDSIRPYNLFICKIKCKFQAAWSIEGRDWGNMESEAWTWEVFSECCQQVDLSTLSTGSDLGLFKTSSAAISMNRYYMNSSGIGKIMKRKRKMPEGERKPNWGSSKKLKNTKTSIADVPSLQDCGGVPVADCFQQILLSNLMIIDWCNII